MALTPRRGDMVKLLSRGRTQLHIPQDIRLSARTVEQHVIMIRARTHAETTVQAIAVLVRQRVV